MIEQVLALTLAAGRLVQHQVIDERGAARRKRSRAYKVLAGQSRERPRLDNEVLMHHRYAALEVGERAAQERQRDHLRIARPFLAYFDSGPGDDADARLHELLSEGKEGCVVVRLRHGESPVRLQTLSLPQDCGMTQSQLSINVAATIWWIRCFSDSAILPR